jgi:hypothetical protein
MFLNSRLSFKSLLIVQVVVILVLATGTGHSAKKKEKDKKKKEAYVMTEAELQSQVMSFADRFASIIVAAFNVYDAQSPPPEHRRIVRGSTVYAMAAAVTIAAEADPDVALLDMVTMVVLGRMVFEEHWRKKFGKQVDPILKGFQKAETDIWQITAKVLTPEQQKELRALIRQWHRDNPEVTFFAYVRFSDFASERRKSKLSKTKAKGIFKTVKSATRQVEEARLLAERGMYLGSRLPMMIGVFADVWLSTVFINPEVNKITADLHQFSDISGRLADLVEKLPNHITGEREAAVKQVMEEMDTFSQVTLDRLMEKVAIERETAIKQLVDQAAIEGRRTIEEFLKAIEQVEAKGGRWVTYSFLLGIALILIFLVGAVVAMLAYRYVSQRMFESPREHRVS